MLVNFEPFSSRFQTYYTTLFERLGTRLNCAMFHFMLDDWCRLTEFRIACFINSVLKCIFRTSLLRSIVVEYDSMG